MSVFKELLRKEEALRSPDVSTHMAGLAENESEEGKGSWLKESAEEGARPVRWGGGTVSLGMHTGETLLSFCLCTALK